MKDTMGDSAGQLPFPLPRGTTRGISVALNYKMWLPMYRKPFRPLQGYHSPIILTWEKLSQQDSLGILFPAVLFTEVLCDLSCSVITEQCIIN